MSINRREFIKVSGLGLGGAAIAGKVLGDPEQAKQMMDRLAEPEVSEKTPTYCEICFWKCAGWVCKDKAGNPWKVIGHEDDQHSFGRLCTRGSGGLGSYTDPDRLKNPLIRRKERGKQIFKEVSWDEALDYIARRMKDIAEKYGPERVALFSHGCGGDFFKTLFKAYGSKNITAPSYAQCRGPRLAAFKLTYGKGLGSPEATDIENSKCLVLIGSHLGENLHNSQVQEFATAIERGCSIITVDPRFSVAASKSKFWLPIKPSTDLALILTWINYLIQNNLYQKDFVAKNTYGFNQLKKEVAKYTPEWAYTVTSIKPELIRETAKEMARMAPSVVVHPSRHVAWYGDDTQRIRAVAILNALLGNWGAKGGIYFQQKPRLPKFPMPKFPKPKDTWKDYLDGQFPFATTAPANFLRDLSLKGGADGASYLKGWIIYGTNLVQCLPQQEQTIEALKNLDLVVAIDTMPAEITGWADVILPECTYVERYDDIRTSAGKKTQIALRAPAFKPSYNTKPGWWIAKELAKKLDLEKYFPWKDIEEFLDFRLQGVGSSLEEMKQLGVKTLPSTKPIYRNSLNLRFKTPSGKIELYSQQLKNKGFDPIPKFTSHMMPQDGYYRLIYGRNPTHTFGRTINNPILSQVMPENDLWIHPDIATFWGLTNGQVVKLKNQDGVESLPIKVKVTERIRTDCVYMAHGFGHTQPQMKRSYKKGASDNDLITQVKVDPIMGGTGFRGNFVTFIV